MVLFKILNRVLKNGFIGVILQKHTILLNLEIVIKESLICGKRHKKENDSLRFY